MSEQPTGRVGLIWIQTLNGVIGAHGDMPWHLPEDLKFFRETTMGHPVIMGRVTWDSIPEQFRPFSGRTSIVVTRDHELAESLNAPTVHGVTSVEEAFGVAQASPGAEEIWVIGGGNIYAQTIDQADVAKITIIRDEQITGDTYAPELDENWKLVRTTPEAERDSDAGWLQSRTGLRYRIERWEKSC
ncbi:dihydrofolate reductase [Micrococcoides hystricis]|uniref:Dihydrofolate reductase n=1 Tax=Micrococcoides hystricis TaxID=1572761 RepID=A0ABV6P920_9MICC